MDEPDIAWLADGFRVGFRVRPLPFEIRPELTALYGLLVSLTGAALADPGLALALLLPPAALAWWATRRAPAQLTVTHERVTVQAPGRRVRVPLRDIREVEIHDDGLELVLWGGRRVRVAAPAPGPALSWVVTQIRALRDDTQRFALEVAQSGHDASRVKRLLAERPKMRARALAR